MHYLKTLGLALLTSLLIASCSDEKDDNPTPPVSGDTLVTLQGNLPTQSLDATKKYLLKGNVFVQSGQTLTIPAGTIIFGDKATKGTLIINRGGKIVADGTREKPIVFTSKFGPGERDKGDWGGIIILGNANVNQNNPAIEGVTPAVNFGTQNSTASDGESSGTLRYVRIEYAGIALSPNNEINGLTLGGVGSGTVLENIMVSYSGDDAFEWFGGTVNARNLVALGTWDDDFDTDFGFTGKVQFALAVRDPFLADQSGSNAFESDNDANGNNVLPATAPVFSNVTVLGPRHDTASSVSGNFQHAIHFRRRTAASIFNSVITGFPFGFRLDGKITYDNYRTGAADVKNNLLISVGNRTAPAPFLGGTGIVSDSVKDYYMSGNPAGFISYLRDLNYTSLGIDRELYAGKNPAYNANPNFAVSAGVISSGASFASPRLGGGFFQTVSFHGAFGASDWTDTWTHFKPNTLTY